MSHVKNGELLRTLLELEGGVQTPSSTEDKNSQTDDMLITNSEEDILKKIASIERKPRAQLPYRDRSIVTKKIIQILNTIPEWVYKDVLPILNRVKEDGKRNPPLRVEATEAFAPSDILNPRRPKTKLPKEEIRPGNICTSETNSGKESKLVCYGTNFPGAENRDPRPLVMTYKKSASMRKFLTKASKSLRNNEIKRSLKKIEQGNLNFGKGAKNVGNNIIESRTHNGLRILTKVDSKGNRQVLAIFCKTNVTENIQSTIIEKANTLFVD